MAEKLYWNTPNVQNITVENVDTWYNKFICKVYGIEYKDLKKICIEKFDKEANQDYFGQILTPINLLGLLQYKINGNDFIVEENEFIVKNINEHKFIEVYLEYFLSYFQYPRHNVNDDRGKIEIRKPYILILILLKKLYDRNPDYAYLTRNEFYYLFNNNDKPYKNYNDINDELIDKILKNNREFGKTQIDISLRAVSYDLALFKNSSILTFNSSDYEDIDSFEFGLSKEYNTLSKLEWLISEEVINDVFEFDSNVTATDKSVISKWANFINNQERFENWKRNVYYSNEKSEIGESGLDSGIESDSIEEDEFVTPFNPEEISIDSKTVSLDSVLRRMKQNSIRLTPPFQRKSVWDDTRKSRLIESMMLKIPLPMFYVSSDKKNNWDVVDGLQRITTIKEFILGKYDKKNEKYDEKGFKLKNLEFWGSLNGLNLNDQKFPGKLFNNIMETELSFTVINPDTPEEVKRNIFKRINTGGMPLTSQEIRHALYQGKSTLLLEYLVENKYFINAVDFIDDSRMAGRELILRFLSFYIRDYVHYTKDSSMDSYLSNTMRIINILEDISFDSCKEEFKNEKNIDFNDIYMSINKKNIEQLINDFELTMKRARKIFGIHTFRKSFPGKRRTPINKTLFEVFGNLLLQLSENEFEILLKNKNEFLEEYKEEFLLTTEFSHMIGRDSHRASSVKKRYSELSSLINNYI
ncbi:DUF262 domain-containing protein [Arcobacter sp.]|uniref:DUF262 domain-containing protein n=1 Tax=unclassified Arcobacter TaxID=2593671 RepID=UPI003B00F87E